MPSGHENDDLREGPEQRPGTSADAKADCDPVPALNGAVPPPRPASNSALGARASALVHALCDLFAQQVQRSLQLELDFTPITLAYVDHYLAQARDEQRPEILSLLSAQAGAYFGEIVRRDMGGFWIGDGDDPRNLRLLLEPQLIHFSPIDMAFESIISDSPNEDDPRHPPGRLIDASFHLDKVAPERSENPNPAQPQIQIGADPQNLAALGPERRPLSDAEWIADRLAQINPVPVDEYYSLTGRFETLQLILELLATKHLNEGRRPRVLAFPDYVAALAT